MSLELQVVSLEEVSPLDLRSPFDELSELRGVLTTQEIAELTGLRRETISRARPDRPFRRRTGRAIGDLYRVVTRLRAVTDGELGHLAAILRRPQPDLGGRSIAELLRAGEVDEVLRHLAGPAPAKIDTSWWPGETPAEALEAFLAADPELAARLPEIEARVREHFGPEVRIERGLDVEPGSEEIGCYLRARNDLSFDENVERLARLLSQEEDLLEPVADRLGIGFL